jgi:hypothetical protein
MGAPPFQDRHRNTVQRIAALAGVSRGAGRTLDFKVRPSASSGAVLLRRILTDHRCKTTFENTPDHRVHSITNWNSWDPEMSGAMGIWN